MADARFDADRATSTTGAAAPATRLECDMVLAGGVTSGVVYPGAVFEIARHYRFRNIGGASAGAIAAAGAAAAEYGRRTGRNQRSFDDLADVAARLGDIASDKRTRLYHLFTPEDETRAPFDLLTLFITSKSCREAARGAMKVVLRPAIAGPTLLAAAGGCLIVKQLASSGASVLAFVAAVFTVLLCIVVAIAMVAALVYIVWRPAIIGNDYGLCRGMAAPRCAAQGASAPIEPLTRWMHRIVQTCAGRTVDDAPLTFGDLWTADGPREGASSERAIDLVMATSDITRQRTAQLPFIESPSRLYIERSLLAAMFPPQIARWMIERRGANAPGDAVGDDLMRLPKPEDLPLVFAMRLSLSFPVLLSAVRMFTPNYATAKRGAGVALRPVWFSDGGLTSNTPVHLFDSPLPGRPTFCINLVDYDAGDWDSPVAAAQPRPAARQAAQRPTRAEADAGGGAPPPGHPVWSMVNMPRDNRAAAPPMVDFSGDFRGFLRTLVNTARFWSDNQLLVAPGVRERIVDIYLRDDEGGLNFDMKPETLAELDLRGRAAGRLIAARFNPHETTDPKTGGPNRPAFVNHRWVRYRNLMGALQDFGWRLARARATSDAVAAADGQPTLQSLTLTPPAKLSYRIPVAARGYFARATRALEALARRHGAAVTATPLLSFDRPRQPGRRDDPLGAAPRPKMRARLRPLVNNDPDVETTPPP